jgi:RNA polymerase sigma-70 factor (family 1)
MNGQTDQELFSNINAGDEASFEYVFITYYDALCKYAYNILKDKSNSEEAVEDIFIKLWENHEVIHINQSIKAYLYKAVHNRCINILNHIKVTNKYVTDSVSNYSDIVSPVSSDYPVANLILKELEKEIDSSLSILPKQCREVFMLIRNEDLSYREAAEKLGVSENTIKTQLHRALISLRNNLKEYLPVIVMFILSF